jgi:hypothetical protein
MSVNYVKRILDTPEYRTSFEAFKGNTCHLVKDLGDNEFIIETLESDVIRTLYEREWYPESFYLLAMTDYLCNEKGFGIANELSDIRNQSLASPIFPQGIILKSLVLKSDEPKTQALNECIPEFRHFNIVESDIRNVC